MKFTQEIYIKYIKTVKAPKNTIPQKSFRMREISEATLGRPWAEVPARKSIRIDPKLGDVRSLTGIFLFKSPPSIFIVYL